ncbi:MAG: UDP-N-acetylmuramoyl-tripeptide--D-alanyl-D-alanine ligase [Christensenellales bacterium]|jgi:UDP-N-acetylmuramoyl-tripeptide--D-alanyl-D-alanine ligase
MTLSFFGLWLLAIAAMPLSLPCVHAWQLEAYKPPQYMRWLRTDTRRMVRALAAGAACAAALSAILLAAALAIPADIPSEVAGWAAAILPAAAVGVWSAVRFLRALHKKPLKFTARIRRLLTAHAALSAVCAAALIIPVYALTRMLPSAWRAAQTAIPLVAYYAATVMTQPLFVVLTGILMRPVENAINRWYFNDAKQRLAAWDRMIRVGITGSYGKTSAKMILGTILAQRFDTKVTPHSYNTPLGVARVIREQMTGREEVFVAEMGARHRGDIAEMCELVAPQYGLLMSVGPQHLETFGSLDNVARTKYELVEALPSDGWAFFPSDNAVCLELYRRTRGNRILFGIDGHGDPLYMTARDIRVTAEGSRFTLVDGEGNAIECATRLLGRHNIINILGCAAVARKLGLTMNEIAAGIRLAEPVEHRLQLLNTGGSVTVIDDAFNSSPDGAKAALEVLSAFEGRRIVVTPGLVELGEAEERENEAFGRNMVAVADVAILVSRNGEAMERGLRQGGFGGTILRTRNLAEASRELAALTRAGDVVLFENDLPDHYEQ